MNFVDFNLAKRLKEKGFNVPCIYAYCEKGGWNMYTQKHEPITYILRTNGNPFGIYYVGKNWNKEYTTNKNKIQCSAPTISQVLKWLREEHHLHFEVVGADYGYNLTISDTPDKGGTDRYYSYANDDGPNYAGAWDKYEDCVLYGIEYVLDNIL